MKSMFFLPPSLTTNSKKSCSDLLKVCVAALTLAMVGAPAHAQENYAAAGTAYSLESGKVVYRELIGKPDENNQVTVSYAKPDGGVFARKVLDYTTEVFQPGVLFTDDRDDETVSAAFDAGRLLLTHKVKGDSQTKTFYETSKLVIDTGIDAIIQQQWAKLVSGKKVAIEFANPRTLTVEKLTIKQINSSESPLAYQGAKDTWRYFFVEPSNKLSSLIAKPVFYAYEPEGKFLIRYQGLANIDNDSGNAWNVKIEYEYFN